MKYTPLLSVLAISFACCTVNAAEVNILCTENFKAPLTDVVQLFESKTGNKVTVRYDKAGRLFGTILNENPIAEVIFTEDQKIPGRLVERGKAIDGTEVAYAKSKLALWSANANLIKDGKSALTSSDIQKVAIPRPNTNIFGKMAQQALNKMGIKKDVEPKIVKVDGVAEGVAKVKNGEAHAAFVDLGLVYKDGKFTEGSGWIIPQNMYKQNTQAAILLNPASKNKTAAEFLKFVTENPEARKIIQSYGYE